MYFTIGFILCGLLVLNYRQNFYRLLINIILSFVSVYLSIVDKITYILPKYIYVKTHVHRTRDLDYTIHEYLGKHNNNKYYKFKIVEDTFYNSTDAFRIYNPNNINMINYCGVINKDGDHIRDITADIRHFLYYKGLIEWKYILVHLGLESNHGIYVCMNDIDMSEKIVYINDIYNEKFNF
jgi:hypothetical protein